MSDAATDARATRLEIYSKWLADDVDGITFAISHPVNRPIATATLAEARASVALALGRLDRAIEQDRQHHAQEHA